MFPRYYSGPNGKQIAVAPSYHQKVANEPRVHDDPFDSDGDRWPGDRFLYYTWNGSRWVYDFDPKEMSS